MPRKFPRLNFFLALSLEPQISNCTKETAAKQKLLLLRSLLWFLKKKYVKTDDPMNPVWCPCMVSHTYRIFVQTYLELYAYAAQQTNE
jgi:hypothetical protein